MQQPQKRPPSAYNLFVKAEAEKCRASGTKFDLTEVARKWKHSNEYVVPKNMKNATLCRGLDQNTCHLAKPSLHSKLNCIWTKESKNPTYTITKGKHAGKTRRSPKPHCASPNEWIKERMN